MSKHTGSAERLAQKEAAPLPQETPPDSLLQWRSSVRSARGIENASQIIANFTRGSMCSGDDSPSNEDRRCNTCTKTEVDGRVCPREGSPKNLGHRRGLHIVFCHHRWNVQVCTHRFTQGHPFPAWNIG